MMPGGPEGAKNVEIDDERAPPGRGDHPLDDAEERRQPELINGSRRLRIANGSGTTTGEVNRLSSSSRRCRSS